MGNIIDIVFRGLPAFDLDQAYQSTIYTVANPTSETAHKFSYANAPYTFSFLGNFTLTAGQVTGGTITGYEIFSGQTKLEGATGLSLDAATIRGDLAASQFDPFYALLNDAGHWLIQGSSEQDDMFGGNLSDKIFGHSGADHLTGLLGKDLFDGGKGNDTLDAGGGKDTLIGGPGADLLYGGAGKDSFVYTKLADAKVGSTHDGIADFSEAQHDVIDLSAIDANTHLKGDQAFQFMGARPFDHGAGELRFAGGFVLGDVDGNGHADLEIAVGGLNHLAPGDFIL